jgi:hypothetical protein
LAVIEGTGDETAPRDFAVDATFSGVSTPRLLDDKLIYREIAVGVT